MMLPVYCGLQVSFNNGKTLADLRQAQRAVIERLDLPEDLAEYLMQLGFLPGATVEAIQPAPGGDPFIYRIDGADIALRRETARHLRVR
jgi:ferrous iron transport protein A